MSNPGMVKGFVTRINFNLFLAKSCDDVKYMSEHYKLLHNNHYKSVGDHWPDVNVSQQQIPGLTTFKT
jgi:hypothetical protein